jgi:hypothetical protein
MFRKSERQRQAGSNDLRVFELANGGQSGAHTSNPARHRRRCIKQLLPLPGCPTKPGTDHEGTRTILCGDDPVFVLYRVASRYGLPVVPEWATWFMRELNQRRAIVPLLGLGCSPVLVRGNKQTFLKWIGRALRERFIRIPGQNGPISWKMHQSATYPLPETRTGANTLCARSLSLCVSGNLSSA